MPEHLTQFVNRDTLVGKASGEGVPQLVHKRSANLLVLNTCPGVRPFGSVLHQ